jgi:hypothetical protein
MSAADFSKVSAMPRHAPPHRNEDELQTGTVGGIAD